MRNTLVSHQHSIKCILFFTIQDCGIFDGFKTEFVRQVFSTMRSDYIMKLPTIICTFENDQKMMGFCDGSNIQYNDLGCTVSSFLQHEFENLLVKVHSPLTSEILSRSVYCRDIKNAKDYFFGVHSKKFVESTIFSFL